MKSHATYAGDPRHHHTDLAELRAENERLRAQVKRLQIGDCNSTMTFAGIHYACDFPFGHEGPHGGVYPHPSGQGDDVLAEWPLIRLLLIWAMASIVVVMLWAAACGPVDLEDHLDDHDDWDPR